MSVKDAVLLATDPVRVARHPFYPFIRYHQRWTKYAEKGQSGKEKIRPIRYAARADAYIFSYYRYLLSRDYEARLQNENLTENVLAYRRILDSSGSGKCNIHFAMDGIKKIRNLGRCCAIAMDISNFFESIDHGVLKEAWKDVIGGSRLPPDHYAVYKAITAYSVVDKEKLYERLGYYGVKGHNKTGDPIKGYLKPPRDIPTKLTTGAEFRRAVAGGNGYRSLIDQNRKPFGVPQGAPISDLLANLYLLKFDMEVRDRVAALGGAYYRYSDDILIVTPQEPNEASDLEAWVRNTIRKYGDKIKIKPEKSALFHFQPSGDNQLWTRVSGDQGKNGLEYLGFRYDGRYMYLRDSTISNFLRKVTRGAKRAAHFAARRYPNKSAVQIFDLFDVDGFIQRYGRVEDFESKAGDVHNWTFWTYVTHAADVCGPLGRPIFKQLRHQRGAISGRIMGAIVNAVKWRDRA
ncbi:reverse transcriptase domain-containing protein [Ollibium composti]|nr:reverse transcriptase domain-containing protein [Mesorhizobium composti]